MGVRDPTIPQIEDQELEQNLIRLLRIIGPLGRLSVADMVVPVVSMGNVVNPTVDILQPSFRSTDVFGGSVLAPGINTVLADTGQLPAGVYDIFVAMESTTAGSSRFQLQHRDAANAVNLMTADFVTGIQRGPWSFPLAYELVTDERLRILNIDASTAGQFWSAQIFARVRP